jgi:hypothetical protein
MKRLFSGLLATLLILTTLYLVTVNVALNLPATRDLINGMQPDRLALSWERAWSLYPLRVQLQGLSADGQTPIEQWQLDAAHAGASVSLLPLLQGEIVVHDLDLRDIDLRLRPRPTVDDDHGELAAYFPVIRNRDPSAVAEPIPEQASSTLILEVDDIHVAGEHAFWVSHIRGTVPGSVRGSFRMDAGVGQLSLAEGALDLVLRSLQIGDRTHVTEHASVRGRVDIPPFRISETEGLELMRIGDLDAQIDLPVRNLDFLALLIPPLEAMDLRGRGRLRGRVVLSAGEFLRGTDLVVEAHELAMGLGRFDFSGDGLVELVVDPANEAQGDLVVRFDEVRGELAADDRAPASQPRELFTGRGLTAHLHAEETDPTTTSTATRAQDLAAEVLLKLVLDIPSMQVADLAVYDRLFPEKWNLSLLGGSGEVSSRMEVTADALSLDLDLTSDEARMRYATHEATTDLLLQLRARVDDSEGVTLDLAGTKLRIADAEVTETGSAAEPVTRSAPWQAVLTVDQGRLNVPMPAKQTEASPVLSAAGIIADEGFGALLGGADGRLSATLTVSHLDWIAVLLNRPMDLNLDGAAKIDAAIELDDGSPAVGTRLTIPPEQLSLALLNHRVDGVGKATLKIEPGRDGRQVRLDMAFDDARMRRRDEPEPSIGEVRMDASLLVRDPIEDATANATLGLKVHSARVHDMRVYNAYLPEHAPLSLLSGEASLVSDLRLGPDNAEGELLLTAADLGILVDEQALSGDLRLQVLVRDGSATDMRFDITGSSLVLEGLEVVGNATSFSGADWHARLQLEDTEVLWQKPMHLDMKADMTVKDTRPFVALLDNLREKPGWFDDMLTVEDLAGHIRLTLDGDRAVVEDALISGPEIGVHAKGRSDPAGREAMLLLRWHNLSAALEMVGDHKHIDIGNAQARFAAYRPEQSRLSPRLSSATDSDVGTRSEHADSLYLSEPPASAGARHAPGGQAPTHGSKGPSRPSNPFLDHSL